MSFRWNVNTRGLRPHVDTLMCGHQISMSRSLSHSWKHCLRTIECICDVRTNYNESGMAHHLPQHNIIRNAFAVKFVHKLQSAKFNYYNNQWIPIQCHHRTFAAATCKPPTHWKWPHSHWAWSEIISKMVLLTHGRRYPILRMKEGILSSRMAFSCRHCHV